MKSKMQAIEYLRAEGFQATEQGYFINIINGTPFVVFWDDPKQGWLCDRPGHTVVAADISGIQRFIQGEL